MLWRLSLKYAQLQKGNEMNEQPYRVLACAIVIATMCALSSFADEKVMLSANDEQAYIAAYSNWAYLSRVNEEAGIPPFGEPPSRSDYQGYSSKQLISDFLETSSKQEAQRLWLDKVSSSSPSDLTANRDSYVADNNARTSAAQREKQRLLQESYARTMRQAEIESSLNAIAEKHGVDRTMAIGEERRAVLAGEIDGHLLWLGSHNLIAGASIGADQLWPSNSTPWTAASTGLGLTGADVTLGMWEAEGAVLESHGEFQGRVIQVDQNPTNPIPAHYHATGVAGTIGAGGVYELSWLAPGKLARGVAYDAFIDAYDINEFASEIFLALAGTDSTPGIRLSNHSYGFRAGWQYNLRGQGEWSWWGPFNAVVDPKYGWYTPDLADGLGSTQLDALLSEDATRHLLVYSAGNDRLSGPGSATNYWYYYLGTWYPITNPDPASRQWFNGDGDSYGFDTILPPGTSKNVMTIGSVLDVFHTVGNQTNWGYSTGTVVTVSSWSAAGPTDDGRIKPDVVAVGEADPAARNMAALVTTHHSAVDALQYQSGTSYAAPAVTAGLGLMLQRRSELFPELDPETDALRGSTLKALAIHTADNIGDPGPSFTTGWGLFNAVSLVRQIELDAFRGRGTHIKELYLNVNSALTWRVFSDGTEPLKVTIAWSDPAGDPPQSLILDNPHPMLVNNLDLTIENDAHTYTWMPWVLNPDLTNKSEAARATAASTGYDDRNNVEQVYISEPDQGYYRITVSHSGGLPAGQSPSAQWVSVVSSGDIPLPPRVSKVEMAPSGGETLLTFESDPGAYLVLETAADLNLAQAWAGVGQLVTESTSSTVLVDADSETRFWRLRRAFAEQ